MSARTAISWTDATFNPWWGCQRVSPGCEHCYAETFARRTGHDVWGKGAERRFFGDKRWAEPLRWNRAAEAAGRPALVFCASMADVFEDRRDLDAERDRLWELIDATPALVWQLLTKRPQNVAGMVPWGDDWPANVWLGTTVEDQRRADERIPVLADLPAVVRFLSCEPLLGPVDLFEAGGLHYIHGSGESGPKHRPLNLDHARSLREQCTAAGVPFFFKQVGGRWPTAGGDELDGELWNQFPAQAGER